MSLSDDTAQTGDTSDAAPPAARMGSREPGGSKGREAARRVGQGLVWTGSTIGRAAVVVGQSIAGAYRSIDPDVRRHALQLPLMGLTLLGARRDKPVEPLPDDGHHPVVFVHGLQGHRGQFLPMQTFFRACGRRRTYSIGLREGQPLRAIAADLASFIDEVAKQNGLVEGTRIDIVAHSMGGLVSRLALFDTSFAARIGTIVTLGSPHSGTHAARYAATHHTRELRPDSATIAALRTQLPWRGAPAQPQLVALWSRSDMLVLPPESAQVEGAENIEMKGFTHFSYLLHPEGWMKAFEALRPGPERS